MNEQQWFSCTDPTSMLEFLRSSHKVSERKFRLFAAACCRRFWHQLKDERSEKAIDVLERWADGQGSGEELAAAHLSAWEAWGTPARAAVSDASTVIFGAPQAIAAAEHAAWANSGPRADERETQAALLRCIIGNPFCPAPTRDKILLAWQDSLTVKLAEAVYTERIMPTGALDPDRLAVLADALEDAGCKDTRLLVHLRGPGPHARGCHVIDLLLNTK